MLFDIIEYKDSKITWNEFLEYLEEVKKEEILRNELEIKFRKSDEYKNNKDKYERILRLGNFQFKTIFDNIYNNKNNKIKKLENRILFIEVCVGCLLIISLSKLNTFL